AGRRDVRPAGGLRVERELAHPDRQRVLRRAPVLAVDLEGAGWERLPGRAEPGGADRGGPPAVAAVGLEGLAALRSAALTAGPGGQPPFSSRRFRRARVRDFHTRAVACRATGSSRRP